MKRFLPLLLSTAAAWAGLTACDTTRETGSLPATSAPYRNAESGQVDTATSFRRDFTRGTLRCLVRTTGEGSRRLLYIRTLQNGRELAQVRDTLDGEVQDAQLTQLGPGPDPQLLVFVNSAGSGSYGEVHGFWFENPQWRRLPPLPELPNPIGGGYQGHDTFRIANRELLRTFPVYGPADANCCPSGGQRTVRYTLTAPAEGFKQVGSTASARAL